MIVITPHAFDRFVERIVPDHSYRDARILFVNRVNTAVPLKRKTFGGQEIWKMTQPDALLIIKRDDNPIVVTVVDPQEEDSITVDFVIMQMAQYDRDQAAIEQEAKLKNVRMQLTNAQSALRNRLQAAEEQMQKRLRGANEAFQIRVKEILDECDEETLRLLRVKELIPPEWKE